MTASPPTKIVEDIWLIRLSWTQAYVLSNGTEFTLVDTGTIRDRELLLAGLAALNLDIKNCQSILLTHGHCDHAGNAAFLIEQSGANCYAHEDERPFLETRRTYVPRGLRAMTPQGLMFAGGEIWFPVRRFKLSGVLSGGNIAETSAGRWRVLHTSGHTPGHVSFYREHDGVLLSGDALLNIIPFVRKEGLSAPVALFNWDTEQAQHSARRLAELQPSALLPGHGRPVIEHLDERLSEFVATLEK